MAESTYFSQSFHDNGFSVLEDIWNRDEVISAGRSSLEILESYLAIIKSEGLHLGVGMKEGYKEIVQRSPKRYDIKVPDAGPLADLAHSIITESSVSAFLSQVLGKGHRLIHQDVVIALPEAKEQQWHTDGSHLSQTVHLPCHCLNLFVPLVDLTESNGATELRPASHFLTRNLKKLWLAAYAKKQIQPPVAPLLKAGSILAFDYRLLHHGTANESSEYRPILVLTFSKPWFVDIFNFPSRSLFVNRLSLKEEKEGEEGETKEI
mmetsp:Transcript_25507/g.33328  ORF Transcript_25507/g.33328 Transcript_25507/m.33328 type:complete len:264 (-) Transcript_25507:422-1213(-)|eukprot:CAMPEP_0117738796 /NCGR_PEP_ID=MMETSP0947-20121206/3353_1 /TAXON_ID=44440 /ORGANISM="Chattonella subsalsa, Strain CCMP2191" /LENGTH=263 /DNA_ID=CAMNT_0005554575 /DNA_START=145 /DNA_END=936 /DNA_ORIENTATION=-